MHSLSMVHRVLFVPLFHTGIFVYVLKDFSTESNAFDMFSIGSFLIHSVCARCTHHRVQRTAAATTTKAGNNNRARRRRRKKETRQFLSFLLHAWFIRISRVHCVRILCACALCMHAITPSDPTDRQIESRMNERILSIEHFVFVYENRINSIKYPYCFWSIKCEGKFILKKRSLWNEVLISSTLNRQRGLTCYFKLSLLTYPWADAQGSRIGTWTAVGRRRCTGRFHAIAICCGLFTTASITNDGTWRNRWTFSCGKLTKSTEWNEIRSGRNIWPENETHHVVWLRLLDHHYC